MGRCRLQARGWLALLATTLAAGTVRAGEPADRGVSFAAWAGAAVDRSVTVIGSGPPLRDVAPMFGLTALGNLQRFAVGGAVDGTPAVLGDGRLSLSALVGYQPEIAGTRFQLLAEVGEHHFSEIGGRMFARQLGPDTWLPFVGARLGIARTLPHNGPFELGLSMFSRFDLGRGATSRVSTFLGEDSRTDYRLGGFVAGIAFHGGLRIESSNPWREAEIEPEN